MSEIKLTFALLFFFTIVVLYMNGKKIKYLPDDATFVKYIKISMPSIIVYTLNEGLRFGRGIDYNLYAKDYFYNVGNSYFVDGDLAFRYVGIFLQSLGLPFQAFVILMSFFLIFSVVIFIRNVKDCAPFALPSFLFLFYSVTENLMRWFFGFSFILIGFSYIVADNKSIRNYVFFAVYSIISFFFHYGLILVPIVYIILIQFKRPILKPFFSILLFILVGVFFQPKMLLFFKDYLIGIFGFLLEERSSVYTSNIDQWLTSGSSILSLSFSIFSSKHIIGLYIVNIVLGYKLCKYLNKQYIVLYNFFLVGFIIFPAAKQIELLLRYQYLLSIYQFIILGYIIDFYFVSKKVQLNKILYLLSIVVYLYFTLSIVRGWFVYNPEYKHLYIWNSNGEKFLDLQQTYYRDLEDMQR